MLTDASKIAMLVIFVVLGSSGCISTAEDVNSSSNAAKTSTNDSIDSNVISNSIENSQVSNELQKQKSKRELEQINEQIALRAAANVLETENSDRFSYRLGPGDVLEIAVFQVEELNRKLRITGDGYIMLPLIGEVKVADLTTTEVETIVANKLAEKYLHDPQVSIFIQEFRSHQVSVSGAVKNPNVYEIQRAQNVLEMLAMAGGLTNDAGPKVYVTRIVADDQGVKKRESTVIELDTLLTSDDPRLNILLRAGDSVSVPNAGVIFVEGAVKSPGAYQIKGNMNILKAIAVAGDIMFEAKRSDVQIFREIDGKTELIQVDLDAIKAREIEDVTLLDGDIIVVPDNKLKKGWSGFWKGISGIFSVGTRI